MNQIDTVQSKALVERAKSEIHRQIVGQDVLIERLLVSLISNGHVLLEGVPGLAKTRTLTAISKCLGVKMNRVQFTPDLLPSDLIGTEVYRPQSAEFVIRKGPVFTNILLADEINRAPAKVQSALLQAMQEREVTIGEETFELPDPFLVLATQNPIEQEGTYPLPEAQLDRFLMKIKVSYPSPQEEVDILSLVTQNNADKLDLRPVLSVEELNQLRIDSMNVYVDPKIDRYIVALVNASRNADGLGLKDMVDWGASPRASIALKIAARSLALLRGRNYATPDDIKELSQDVLRHRILPSFEAEARGIKSEDIITIILKNVQVP